MNALQMWVRTPLAQTLGWTLFHFLWEGALIALALAAALVFARPSARLRYALACLAMLAMPAAAVVTFAICTPAPQAVPVPLHSPAALHSAVPQGPLIWPLALPQRRWEKLAWIAPFWFAGVILFYLYSLASWIAARRLRQVGVCPAAADWHVRLGELAQRLGLTRPVVLLESCLTDVPLVIGFVKPVILMPVGLLTGLSMEQVECILIHELAHVRRHDYLVNLMQSFVEGLLFYHPAVWWVSGLVRAERENCCDDVVVKMRGDARGYAIALATLEQNRWPARDTVLAATGGSLMNRIRRLLKQPEGPRVALTPVFSAVVLCATAGVVLAAWDTKPAVEKTAATLAPVTAAIAELTAQPLARPVVRPADKPAKLLAQVQAQTPTAAQADPPQAGANTADQAGKPTGPYRKWLNEDVAYIITDAERAAFKSIQSDPEHEKFIEQFWVRRDPTPGTEENEFKEEHYRRIGYANEHFASYVPGWKTDRGRIYITFGPPDEIEDHSAGGSYVRPPEEGGGTITTVPFQQWRYKFIEGVGNNIIIEFVDPNRSGEFRMTSDPSQKDALAGLAKAPGDALTVNTMVAAGQASGFQRMQASMAGVQPAGQAQSSATAGGGGRGNRGGVAAAAPGAVPNLFTSGRPGPALSVEVRPGKPASASARPTGTAVLNVGLSQGAGPFTVTASVLTTAGNAVANSVDQTAHLCADAGGPWPNCLQEPVWRGVFSLAPGTYKMTIQVKNAAGETGTNEVQFFVN